MCFLAEHPIFGDIIQKKITILPEHQKDKNFVLTRDRLGYGDGILMLEKSVGVQKMKVYGCTVYKKMRFFGSKMGLKPAQEPPEQSSQHKKVPICLILTTLWDEITFGHIKR